MRRIEIEERLIDPDLKEAYNKIVSMLYILNEKDGHKTFTLSGCEPDVGNTTICIDLAIAFAELGKKTLIVDCDFKKEPEKKPLHQFADRGLFDYLLNGTGIDNVVYKTNFNGLYYIPGGKPVSNIISLLWSEKFNSFMEYAVNDFDFVFFDSSPLPYSSEANILASKTSGTIITAQFNKSKTTQLNAAKREIARSNANFLGVILNKTDKAGYDDYVKNFSYGKQIS